MYQIEIFTNESLNSLEKNVNEWLSNTDNYIRIINISEIRIKQGGGYFSSKYYISINYIKNIS